MPVINDAARTTLKELFAEVANRANRLSEWLRYDDSLRPLQNSFDIFLREVEAGVDREIGFKDGSQARIKMAWFNCRGTQLMEVEIFNNEVELINKPLNEGAGPAARVRYNVAEFFRLRALIDADLGRSAAMDLKDHSLELDIAIRTQAIILRTSVQSEMKDLTGVTKQLSKEFERA
jgi:hypothetical protein